MSKAETTELRERLAAIEHERWADWQKWCHQVLRENNPSPEQGDILERWDRQIETPYTELSDREKASDMEQVDRYWSLVEEYVRTEVCKALNSIELPDAEILTTKYGHNSTEKKYGYSVAMFEANDAIAKVKAEYEVKE